MSASLASVVTSIRRRIFGNGTSISSSNCVPRRSRVDSALIVMALSSTPCFFAHFGLIDDRPDVAHGNFRARVGRTVTPNTLRDGGLLSHGNHDVAPIVSIGVIEIREGSRLP